MSVQRYPKINYLKGGYEVFYLFNLLVGSMSSRLRTTVSQLHCVNGSVSRVIYGSSNDQNIEEAYIRAVGLRTPFERAFSHVTLAASAATTHI